MSELDKKIASLVKLLDDPDEEVLKIVWDEIIAIGPRMIPALEKAWDLSPDTQTVEGIEELIHVLRMQELSGVFDQWINNKEASLIQGCWLVARIQYPLIKEEEIRTLLQPLRDEIWLELHNQLTALEKIKVVNHYYYEQFKFLLNLKNPELPGNHFINQLIETI